MLDTVARCSRGHNTGFQKTAIRYYSAATEVVLPMRNTWLPEFSGRFYTDRKALPTPKRFT